MTAVFVARRSAARAADRRAAPGGFPWEAAEEARRGVEEIFRELSVSITFIAASGDPFTELCRVAFGMGTDAVVVGASARAGHRLAGSLAVRLVKAARWPVTGDGGDTAEAGRLAVLDPDAERAGGGAAACVSAAGSGVADGVCGRGDRAV